MVLLESTIKISPCSRGMAENDDAHQRGGGQGSWSNIGKLFASRCRSGTQHLDVGQDLSIARKSTRISCLAYPRSPCVRNRPKPRISSPCHARIGLNPNPNLLIASNAPSSGGRKGPSSFGSQPRCRCAAFVCYITQVHSNSDENTTTFDFHYNVGGRPLNHKEK